MLYEVITTFGPRLVILFGGLMFGGGMFLSGYATQLDHLILSYGILTGLGLGMVYGATISTSIKFFPDKRGVITSYSIHYTKLYDSLDGLTSLCRDTNLWKGIMNFV